MYIVMARGGEYEDAWKANLFLTPDEIFADLVVGWFDANKEACDAEKLAYREKANKFMEEWDNNNPAPEFVELPKPIRPVHPVPHPSLKGLTRKQKKDNPYQKIYIEELRAFERQLSQWEKDYSTLRAQEEAPSDNWLRLRSKIKEDFYQNNFKPNNYIPLEWQEKMAKFQRYFTIASSFFYEEVEIFLPQQ